MITNRSQNHSAPVRNGFPSIDCPLPRRTEGFGSGTCILKSLRRLCTCAAFTLLTRNLQQRILIRFYGSATTDLRKRNAVNDKEKRPALCLQVCLKFNARFLKLWSIHSQDTLLVKSLEYVRKKKDVEGSLFTKV